MDLSPLWTRLDRLLLRMAEAEDRDTFLDECLDALLDQLGADRGMLILHFQGGGAQVILGRAARRPLGESEREELSRTIVDRARAEQRTVVVHPLDEAEGTESMDAFGIATAIARPIRPLAWQRGDADGVVYLDYRLTSKQPAEADLAFLEAASRLLGAAIGRRSEASREREAGRRDELVLHGARRSLAELLAPPSLSSIRREVASLVHGDTPVLILGESGTGKTELARAIAEEGGRTPVVRCTLGASDDLNTITSELFGHERGAYSGALAKRVGVVEFAHGGTLIFDEILNLPAPAQQLLLDFTQFGTYRPLGYAAREPRRADVRLIAATNGDLRRATAEGRFREDLYFRLAGATITLPALRDRRADIPAIAESILASLDPTRPKRLSLAMRRLLSSDRLPWPGNVRQLELVLRRARERANVDDEVVLGPEHTTAQELGVAVLSVPDPRDVAVEAPVLTRSFEVETAHLADSYARLLRERAALEEHERRILAAALERENGVVAHVAREIGVPRTTLASRLEALGLARAKKPARR